MSATRETMTAPAEIDEGTIDPVMLRCYEVTMEKWYRVSKGLGVTKAGTKEDFYGFRASDIAKLHFQMMGFGTGLFFRLRDGRVFDAAAREHNPDPLLYDQSIQ